MAAAAAGLVGVVEPAGAGAGALVAGPRPPGRPDLGPDAFAALRAQQRRLKAEASKLTAEVKKRTRA